MNDRRLPIPSCSLGIKDVCAVLILGVWFSSAVAVSLPLVEM